MADTFFIGFSNPEKGYYYKNVVFSIGLNF
jgi:hypothetical protein